MADKNLSSIVGSGNALILSDFTGAQTVASGASGDVLTITPPSGKSAVLAGLAADTLQETGVTITVGTRTFVSSKTLTSGIADSSGEFNIGSLSVTATSQNPGNIQMLIGRPDEVIRVTKDTGSTANIINYSSATAE